MTKPKHPAHLTTEGALRRLFPTEVRKRLRQEAKKSTKRRKHD